MPSVTLAELDARVLGRVDLNSAFYPANQRLRAINHGIRVLNLVTGFLQTTAIVYSQADRPVYDTPAGILIPLRIDMDGVFIEKNPFKSLCQTNPPWITETSNSTGVGPHHWSPIGITKFALHPGDSRGGKLLAITGVQEPTPLVNGTDVIGYPNEFADAIEDYAAHLLMMKAGGTVSVQSMYMYSAFLSRANELKRYKQKIAPLFRVAEAEVKK